MGGNEDTLSVATPSKTNNLDSPKKKHASKTNHTKALLEWNRPSRNLAFNIFQHSQFWTVEPELKKNFQWKCAWSFVLIYLNQCSESIPTFVLSKSYENGEKTSSPVGKILMNYPLSVSRKTLDLSWCTSSSDLLKNKTCSKNDHPSFYAVRCPNQLMPRLTLRLTPHVTPHVTPQQACATRE